MGVVQGLYCPGSYQEELSDKAEDLLTEPLMSVKQSPRLECQILILSYLSFLPLLSDCDQSRSQTGQLPL